MINICPFPNQVNPLTLKYKLPLFTVYVSLQMPIDLNYKRPLFTRANRMVIDLNKRPTFANQRTEKMLTVMARMSHRVIVAYTICVIMFVFVFVADFQSWSPWFAK